jgi:fructuronate reductase
MARFENPKIRHLLRQIACDGSIKIPVRTLSPLIENINAGRGISALSIVVASWLHFIKDSVINNIDLQDPRANDLANAFEQQIQKNSDEVFNVRAFINLPGLMPDSLIDNDTFLDSVTKAYNESCGFFYK